MPDALPTRLVFRVSIATAMPIEGTAEMLVTLRTDANQPLTLRLTRPEAAELMALILAEQARERRAAAATGGA